MNNNTSQTPQLPKNIQTILEKERFNEKSIKELELYVEKQITENSLNSSDIDANLALLKLYQFYPKNLNEQIVIKILIKSLSKLPSTDFQQCLFLIPYNLMVSNWLLSLFKIFSSSSIIKFSYFF